MSDPERTRPVQRVVPVLTRRTLLWDLGGAVAFLATAACTGTTTTTDPSTGARSEPGPPAATPSGTPDPDAVRWERVIGGASAAYVLVRGGEATIVDTGQSGTELAIQDGLEMLGLDWDDVSSVVLTHRHPDHVGSLDEVATRAAGARLLAGEADIEAIAGPRTMAAIGTGSRVMDLEVFETPGHTPGHVSLFDAATRRPAHSPAGNGRAGGWMRCHAGGAGGSRTRVPRSR